ATGHHVDVVGQVLPAAGDAAHLGLAAELALGADLAGHARDLRGDAAKRLDHLAGGFLELAGRALRLDRDLLGEVAVGDRGLHHRDVAHLRGEVARELVDVVGEVLPGACDAADPGLGAELALGAALAGDADDLGPDRLLEAHHV